MRIRFATLLACLAGAMHSFAQVCPPPAVAPVAQSPANATVTSPVTFTWTAATPPFGASVTGYEVHAGATTGNLSTICETSATSCTVSVLPGTYGWKVSAKLSSNVCSLESNGLTFTVGCPQTAPTLTFPAAGATNVSQIPTLQWNPVSDADTFDVYLGTTGNGCSGGPVATSNGTSFTPPVLQPATTYEWRVAAKRGATNCPPQFSSCQTFTTAAATSCNPAGAFTLTSPANGATIGTPPAAPISLSWSASAGAAQYFVHLGTSNPPPAAPAGSVAAPATSFNAGTLSPGTYYWYVTAVPACGAGGRTDSSVFTFTVLSDVAPICPTTPKLESPSDSAINVVSPVKFDWERVDGATSYRLFAILAGSTASTTLTTTTDTEFTASVPAGATEWWVAALNAQCPAVESAHFHFTAAGGGCASHASPTTVAPANGATGLVSPVSFQWTAVPGASGYRVWGILASTSSSAPLLIGTTSGATQLSAAVPQGQIAWYAEARFDNCPSTFSSRSTITVATGAACSTTGTTLLVPQNNAAGVQSPVTFQWTAVSGSIGYKLYIDDDLAGVTTDTSLTKLVGDGKNSWRVDTMFAGCPDVRSAQFSFTAGSTATCAGSIRLTAPAAGVTVASPVNAAWTAVSNATTYRVYAAIDGGEPELLVRTTSTSRSLSLPSGSIELFVEALFDDCPSIFSPRVKLTVTKGANCDAHRPATLVSPVGGAASSAEVEFKWTSSDTALLYRVWVSTNDEPFASVGVTTATQLERTIGPGKGVWYVESIFDSCPSVSSAKATFTIPETPHCSVSAPLLVSPADGAPNVAAPVTLAWNAVPETDDYRVFLSLDGAAFVQVAETDEETSITRALPAGSYRWFVEAVLEGCAAVRSSVSRFTIPRAQSCPSEPPQLLAPANGANNVASPVAIDWAPVSSAIGYIVYARVNDGAITRVDETVASRLKRHFPDGTIEWWVVALFNGCPSLESKHFTFTIPAAAGCDNPKPLLYAPADRAVGITSPAQFIWSQIPGATKYKVWASTGVDDDPSVIGSTTDNKLTITVPAGTIRWYVEATFADCPPVQSAVSTFAAVKTAPACAPPTRPVATAPAQVASGTPFNIRWNAVANSSSFQLEESATPDFANATSQIVSDLFATFTHTAAAPQKWFYRVRAVSNCLDERGPFSHVVTVFVLPDGPQQKLSVEAGTQNVTQKVFIPGKNPPLQFTATTDKPWATVLPSSGTIGPNGVTLTVTYKAAALKLGTNAAAVIINYSAAAKVGAADVTAKTTVPVSISTVTPVSPGGKSAPPPNSLIIPVVGHAAGVNNALFESDVRVANTSTTTQKYQLNFTLSGSDGTKSGQSTTIQIAPGDTMALDDILTTFFGIGSDGSGATGVLEIRPLTTSTSVTSSSPVNIQTTTASSRTYNTTPTGTFGQFIPAIPFAQFIGQTTGRLTLQQVAQSSAFRTNLGLAEGAGEPASVLVHVFDAAGAEVAAVPVSLQPGEHKQLNSFLAANNLALQEGRFEIEVTSPTGKVTAYASTVDNATGDPLCVLPVLKGAVTSSRYVIPGVADLNSPFYSWRSDIRVYNSGTSDVTATATYYPQPGNAGATAAQQITIKTGEVKAIDNALQSLFGLTNSGGALLITTPAPAPLVVTARTYNQTDNGTYGQFIPAVTPAQATGLGERTLQILQMEQSDRFRSNIGVAETSGNPVTVEISAIVPDSKFTLKVPVDLAPNEFRQFSLGTDGFNLTNAYNVRVTVRVIAGTGRVTAYGSMIDQSTQDPTYVPPDSN